MFGKNSTIYLRLPFWLATFPQNITRMELRARYNDGFVAYLNGQPVARANAAQDELPFNATALTPRSDADTLQEQAFDLTQARTNLVRGENLLAIQALSHTPSDAEFLCIPELYAVIEETPFEAWVSGYSGLASDMVGPGDDPDGDGYNNHLEFALGSDPSRPETIAERQALGPQARITKLSDGTNHFQVEYLRRSDPQAAGLNYQLLFSRDMSPGSWRLAGTGPFPAEISSRPAAVDDMVVVTTRLVAPIDAQQAAVFSVLRIW